MGLFWVFFEGGWQAGRGSLMRGGLGGLFLMRNLVEGSNLTWVGRLYGPERLF